MRGLIGLGFAVSEILGGSTASVSFSSSGRCRLIVRKPKAEKRHQAPKGMEEHVLIPYLYVLIVQEAPHVSDDWAWHVARSAVMFGHSGNRAPINELCVALRASARYSVAIGQPVVTLTLPSGEVIPFPNN